MNPRGQLSTSDIKCPHCHWRPKGERSFGEALQKVQRHYFTKHPSDPVGLTRGKNPIGFIGALGAIGESMAGGAATGIGVGTGYALINKALGKSAKR